MAILSDNFNTIWALAGQELVGTELPVTPVNSLIGSYGFRSVGFVSPVISANAHAMSPMVAVEGDSRRANVELLTIRQLRVLSSAPGNRAGLAARCTGAAGAENGYVAYFKEEQRPSAGISVFYDTNPTLRYLGISSVSKLNFGTGSFTVEAKFVHTSYTSPHTFGAISKPGGPWNTSAGWGFGQGYLSNGVSFFMHDGTNFINQNVVFDVGYRPTDFLNVEVLVSYVVDRALKKVFFYVNGVLQSTTVDISTITGSVDNAGTLGYGTAVGWMQSGTIRECRAWNVARTGDQVRATKDISLTGIETGLVGYWRLDDNTGTNAKDRTAAPAAGSIFSSSWVPDPNAVTLAVGKLVAGVFTELDTVPVPVSSVLPLQDYYLSLRTNGTKVYAKAWKFGDIEPSTWMVGLNDSSVAGVGSVGFYTRALTANTAGYGLPGFLSAAVGGERAPRPRSDVELKQWLNDDSNVRVLLAEAGVLGQLGDGSGNPSFALMSNTGYYTLGSDTPPYQVYDEVLIGTPTITSRAPDFGKSRSSKAYGTAVVDNTDGVRDHWLTYNWAGRSFDMYLGGHGWRKWDFIHVLSATIQSLSAPRKGVLSFALQSKAALLDQKVQTQKIGGSEATAGAPQPDCFGDVFNIEPVLKSGSTLRYKYHSGSLAGAPALLAVRDTTGPVLFTDYPASGEFELNASPTNTGQITCDVNVTLSDGSVVKAGRTHGNLIRTLVEDRAGQGVGSCYLGLRSGSLASFGGDPAAVVGLYVKEETNILDLLDQVAQSAGGWWYQNDLGQVCASLWRVPTSPYDHYLSAPEIDNFSIEDILGPSDVEQLGYRKNWTVQSTFLGTTGPSDRARYSSEAQFTTVVPTYSGLDQPSNHLLRERPKNRVTLFKDAAAAQAEVLRRDGVRRKICAKVSFDTKVDAPYYNEGESVFLTYPHEQFVSGRAGIICALEKNLAKTITKITMFVQFDAFFPTTTAQTPFVTVKDFYR